MSYLIFYSDRTSHLFVPPFHNAASLRDSISLSHLVIKSIFPPSDPFASLFDKDKRSDVTLFCVAPFSLPLPPPLFLFRLDVASLNIGDDRRQEQDTFKMRTVP